MKKKILYVITKSNWGGAQAYAYTLASHFNTQATVAVALGGTGEKDASTGLLAERLTAAGVRIIFLKSFARDISILREFMTFFELLRTIKSEKPDVLHLNSSKAGGLGALAGRVARVPKIVFTSHGLAYDEDRLLPARVLIWLATWVTVMLTHTTIVISQDTYERARRLPFCKNKVKLIYNGIAPTTLLDGSLARAKLLQDAAQKDAAWIGTIAELTRNKALTYLVRAASILKKRGYSFELCIIGIGEEQVKLETLIKDEDIADRVHLLGFVANAITYLKAFDIFTLVSVKEGLPYVLLEAAQAKCAVVGSLIPGNTDIIDDTTGMLVEPKNAEAIADAIEILLTDTIKRTALGEELYKKVLDKFSLELMIKKIGAVYH